MEILLDELGIAPGHDHDLTFGVMDRLHFVVTHEIHRKTGQITPTKYPRI